MSKKKKVSVGKKATKSAAKKPVKTSSKPAARKADKKAAPKKSAPKKPVTKSAKKPIKVVKTATKKNVVVKKAAKPIPKKPSKQVVTKSAKKTVPAKKPVKSAPANGSKTVAAKKPEVKNQPAKPAKAIAANLKSNAASVKPVKTAPSPAIKNSEPVKGKIAAVATAPGRSEDTASKKSAGKSPEVLAITNTIPVAPKHEIPMSKIVSISHSITNPVRKTDSYAVKSEKEPAGKFEMEFVLHSSAEMLYEFLSTASGLSEWFCDDLNIRNGIYTFIWDDQLQQARLLKTVEFQIVRFQWVDKTDGSYFEFRIQKDDLTNDIALIITDFADTNAERESSKLLWTSQIEKLRHVIGSIF